MLDGDDNVRGPVTIWPSDVVDLLIRLAWAAGVVAALMLVAWYQKRRYRRTGKLPRITVGSAWSIGVGGFILPIAVDKFWQWHGESWQKALVAVGAVLLGIPLLLAYRRWSRRRARGRRSDADARSATVPAPVAPAGSAGGSGEDLTPVTIPLNREGLKVFMILFGLLGVLVGVLLLGVAAFPRQDPIKLALFGVPMVGIALWVRRRLADPRPNALLDATGFWHRRFGSIAWTQIEAVRAVSCRFSVVLCVDLRDEEAWRQRLPLPGRLYHRWHELWGPHGVPLSGLEDPDQTYRDLQRFLARYGSTPGG